MQKFNQNIKKSKKSKSFRFLNFLFGLKLSSMNELIWLTDKLSWMGSFQKIRALDHSVFVSLFGELFWFVLFSLNGNRKFLYSLSYIGSHDLASQWPTVHNQHKNKVSVQNQNKQRLLSETFKTRWYVYILSFTYIKQAMCSFKNLLIICF